MPLTLRKHTSYPSIKLIIIIERFPATLYTIHTYSWKDQNFTDQQNFSWMVKISDLIMIICLKGQKYLIKLHDLSVHVLLFYRVRIFWTVTVWRFSIRILIIVSSSHPTCCNLHVDDPVSWTSVQFNKFFVHFLSETLDHDYNNVVMI